MRWSLVIYGSIIHPSLSITACICVLSLSFSQETRCRFKLFDEKHMTATVHFFTFGSDVMYTRVCQCIYLYIYTSIIYIYIDIYISIYIYIYIYIYLSTSLYIHTRILALVLGIVYIVFVWIGCMMLTSYFQASSHMTHYRAAKETSWDPPTSESDWGRPVSGFGRLKIAMGMFNLIWALECYITWIPWIVIHYNIVL